MVYSAMRPWPASLPLFALFALSDQADWAQLRPSFVPKQALAAAPEVAGIYRVSGTNPNGSAYRGMVALGREGDKVMVTWWIGEQVLHGTGRRAGKTLAVNWGHTDPVIYSSGEGGVLDG